MHELPKGMRTPAHAIGGDRIAMSQVPIAVALAHCETLDERQRCDGRTHDALIHTLTALAARRRWAAKKIARPTAFAIAITDTILSANDATLSTAMIGKIESAR
jgi:hypothetical protein